MLLKNKFTQIAVYQHSRTQFGNRYWLISNPRSIMLQMKIFFFIFNPFTKPSAFLALRYKLLHCSSIIPTPSKSCCKITYDTYFFKLLKYEGNAAFPILWMLKSRPSQRDKLNKLPFCVRFLSRFTISD